jgi:hypothetical protein
MRRRPLKVNQSFGGIRRLHSQSQRINQVRNQPESDSNLFWLLPDSLWFLVIPLLATYFTLVSGKPCTFYLLHADFFVWLILRPWWRMRYVPPKRQPGYNENQDMFWAWDLLVHFGHSCWFIHTTHFIWFLQIEILHDEIFSEAKFGGDRRHNPNKLVEF